MLKKIIKKITPYSIYSKVQDGLNFIISFKYVGSKYYCPFCSVSFDKFLPAGLKHDVIKEKNIIGAGFRNNAVCPRCLSYDRERLIYLYLNKYKSFMFNKKIKLLHVAPEKNLSKLFSSYVNIDYISADLNHPSALVKMDITSIKYCENTFDVVLCNHVLEHVPDDNKAILEIYRVLKPSGFGILQVPISYTIANTEEDLSITACEDRIKNYGQEDHVRLYGKDYLERLVSVGFKVDVFDFISELSDIEIERYSLLQHEKLFIVYK